VGDAIQMCTLRSNLNVLSVNLAFLGNIFTIVVYIVHAVLVGIGEHQSAFYSIIITIIIVLLKTVQTYILFQVRRRILIGELGVLQANHAHQHGDQQHVETGQNIGHQDIENNKSREQIV